MFLRIAYLLLLTVSLSAQSIRPQLNGLESRKGQMILAAQSEAQADLTQANTQLSSATNALAHVKAGSAERTGSQFTAAKHKQAAAQLRVTQLTNQLSDWESSTLKVHAADPAKFKADWKQGQIVAK